MSGKCWLCNDRDEQSRIGLCDKCRDELHAEILIPPGKTLLPPGTLPEEVPPYRSPQKADYVSQLQ